MDRHDTNLAQQHGVHQNHRVVCEVDLVRVQLGTLRARALFEALHESGTNEFLEDLR